MSIEIKKTIKVIVEGESHTVDITAQDCSWARGNVSYDDKQVHIDNIDGGCILDFYLQDADKYSAICKEAKIQGLKLI